MSDFDDAIADGLSQSLDYLGTKSFQIGSDTFTGLLNQFSGERELSGEGPFVGTYPATILAALPQFIGIFPAPLERTLPGKRLTIDGRTLRIAGVAVDASSLTLTLENVDAAK